MLRPVRERENLIFLNMYALIAEVELELLPNCLCSFLFEFSQAVERLYDQVPVLLDSFKFLSFIWSAIGRQLSISKWALGSQELQRSN